MSGLAFWCHAQLRFHGVMAPERTISVIHGGRHAMWASHPFSTAAPIVMRYCTGHFMIQQWRRSSPAAASTNRDCDKCSKSGISSAFQRTSATDRTELAAAARWVGAWCPGVGHELAVPSTKGDRHLHSNCQRIHHCRATCKPPSAAPQLQYASNSARRCCGSSSLHAAFGDRTAGCRRRYRASLRLFWLQRTAIYSAARRERRHGVASQLSSQGGRPAPTPTSVTAILTVMTTPLPRGLGAVPPDAHHLTAPITCQVAGTVAVNNCSAVTVDGFT
jgi:hypothetical protein